MAIKPRVYRLSAVPGRADTTFRVSSGGRYDRWDPASKSWVHVEGDAGREYLSRAVESGDAVRTDKAAEPVRRP